MKGRSLFFLSMLAAGPLLAADRRGVPWAGEFRVNSYTTGWQNWPQIATTPNDGFVVVWNSGHEGGPDAPYGFVGQGSVGIFARLFGSAGRPLGPEFPVNEFTTGRQFRPSVAVAPNGEFVVAWTGYGDGGTGSYGYYDPDVRLGGYRVVARHFAADGTPLGGEFQVNTYTTNYQGGKTSVAMSESGDFVVVWKSGYYLDAAPQDGDGYGLFGQRFAAGGAPLGGEFQVNGYTTRSQYFPSVATASNGDFVVAWQSSRLGSYEVVGQRFAADGAPQGDEFQVNTYTTGGQREPSIASASNGDFVVVWRGRSNQDGSLDGVFGQRFLASGAATGSEFRINTYTTGNQNGPSVAAAPNGDFVVTWTSGPAFPPQVPTPFLAQQDGSLNGVFGQAFSAAGAPVGSEFQVNTYTTDNQMLATVTVRPSGQFVVAWRSPQDGSYLGVFGRRFAKPKN